MYVAKSEIVAKNNDGSCTVLWLASLAQIPSRLALLIYHHMLGTHRRTGCHHPKWWHWIIYSCIQRTRSSDISLTSAELKSSDCTLTTNNSTTIMYHCSRSIIIMCCLRLPLVTVRRHEDGWELIPPLLSIKSERSSQELWECPISLDVILIHVSS